MIFRIIRWLLQNSFVQSYRQSITSYLLKWQIVRKRLHKSVNKESRHFIEKNKQLYQGHIRYLTIPEKGLSYFGCLRLILEYCQKTLDKLKGRQFSGTIYQDTLIENFEELSLCPNLESLYLEIFRRCHMWNSLHDEEFYLAHLINLQIISCVADLFGGKLEDINGLVTTGGTQSMMTSARIYLNYAMEERGLRREDCIIVAPDTIHASLMKASVAYGFRLVLFPTNRFGQLDTSNTSELFRYVKRHHQQIIALYCSSPSFPYGTMDNVSDFAYLACRYNIGLHVDCCLGGFVVNFIYDYYSHLLSEAGITSISVDTHKNGLAPKGSSVLITKKLRGINLLNYSIYSFPDWKGGLYGTPKDEGSSSCVEAFCALITILYYGKVMYRMIANDIQSAVSYIIKRLMKNKDIEIITPNIVNIIAFRLTLFKGATYRLSQLMYQEGYVFNNLTDDIIHFCVTYRFTSQIDAAERFMSALDECLKNIKKEKEENPQVKYDGTAQLYCSLDTIRLDQEDKSLVKYLENYFLGKKGIEMIIRNHFLAINNPYLRQTK